MSLTNLKYQEVFFDSDEEVFFAMWLEELKTHGYVVQWNKLYHPIILTKGLKVPYKKLTQLKTKLKVEDKEKHLLKPSEYTPDFRVYFSEKAYDSIASFIEVGDFNPTALFYAENDGEQRKEIVMHTVEVKPHFDQNNMERLFVNNQKFIWDKYKIFVNLIEPIELFKKTFVPLQAMPYLVYRKKPTSVKNKHKKVGDFKFDFTPKTIEQWLDEIKKP
jgi:hypothetical protein